MSDRTALSEINIETLTERLKLIIEQHYIHTDSTSEQKEVNINHILEDCLRHLSYHLNRSEPVSSQISRPDRKPLGVDKLSNDCSNRIVDLLSFQDIVNTSAALTTCHSTLFKHHLKSKQLQLLLTYVMSGNQDAARKILQQDPTLLLLKGDVTDVSGRKFKNVYALQCVLWTWDTLHMYSMMFDCIPADEQGKMIKEALLHQYNEHKTTGLTITLNGTTYQEKHYDFSPVLAAVKAYHEQINYTIQQDEIHQHELFTTMHEKWCEMIRLEYFLPAHVIQHLCFWQNSGFLVHDRPSICLSTFKEKTFIRQPTESWYSFMASAPETYCETVSHLTSDFTNRTLYIPASKNIKSADYHFPKSYMMITDLNALTRLNNVRKNDYIQIEQQLKDSPNCRCVIS